MDGDRDKVSCIIWLNLWRNNMILFPSTSASAFFSFFLSFFFFPFCFFWEAFANCNCHWLTTPFTKLPNYPSTNHWWQSHSNTPFILFFSCTFPPWIEAWMRPSSHCSSGLETVRLATKFRTADAKQQVLELTLTC